MCRHSRGTPFPNPSTQRSASTCSSTQPMTAKLFHAIYEALSPGGCLLLLVPAHPFLFGAPDHALKHDRRYRRDSLRILTEQQGFAVEEIRYVNPVGALGWLVNSRLLGRPGWAAQNLRSAGPRSSGSRSRESSDWFIALDCGTSGRQGLTCVRSSTQTARTPSCHRTFFPSSYVRP